jgi:hypothetical protein
MAQISQLCQKLGNQLADVAEKIGRLADLKTFRTIGIYS